jgi:7-cyano-7-deazaguanine synthase
MEPTRAVLLASGGMDSTTLAFWLHSQQTPFIPLFIDYGQHCAQNEYRTLLDVVPMEYRGSIESVAISQVYRHSTSRLIREPDLWTENMSGDPLYLPYRNLLLLSVAAAYAQSRGLYRVYAGFINSNHAKEIDCSSSFFKELDGLLSEYGSVRIEMPFREMSKVDVARLGLSLGVPLGATFSCQASSIVPCGACPNCVDRIEALRQLSAADE